MLTEAGAVLWFERVAHDVAVARYAVRVAALVGSERHRNLHRRTGRQTGGGEAWADERASNPFLGFEKSGHLADESPGGIGEIKQGRRAVGCDDDLRRRVLAHGPRFPRRVCLRR